MMRRWFAVLGLALVFILAACSGGAKSAVFNVEMNEFTFKPNTYTVPAGVQVTLNLKNSGTLEHNWVLMKAGAQATAPFDASQDANVYWKQTLMPGESGAYTFTAPAEPGAYQVVCITPGHLEQGMTGTLTVTK